MHWRKDLTIETQFFEDGLEGIPDAVLVNTAHSGLPLKTERSEDYDAWARTSV
jgi:hypothetical protein